MSYIEICLYTLYFAGPNVRDWDWDLVGDFDQNQRVVLNVQILKYYE